MSGDGVLLNDGHPGRNARLRGGRYGRGAASGNVPFGTRQP